LGEPEGEELRLLVFLFVFDLLHRVRSHACPIADTGKILHRLSPQRDILAGMVTEAHFRPVGP